MMFDAEFITVINSLQYLSKVRTDVVDLMDGVCSHQS